MRNSDSFIELRGRMEALGLDALIIPSGDPHLSEYVADHWQVIEWLCGFTGSNGTLVVTRDEAGIWVDSRYYLQADRQLAGLDIQIFKDGAPGVQGYATWLKTLLLPGDKVGVNGTLISVSTFRNLSKELQASQIQLVTAVSAAEDIWIDRPPIPPDMIFVHDEKWTGTGRAAKLSIIREAMIKEGANYYITASLDDIAWALNLRGSDVPCCPVFHSYLVVGVDGARLFVNPHKLTAATARDLAVDDVNVHHYDHFFGHVKDFTPDVDFLIDPDRLNSIIYSSLPRQARKLERPGIIPRLKSVKNEIEIANLKQTLVSDGVAMVEFLSWLENNVASGQVTELSAAAKLKALRTSRPNFHGESFSSISAYGENAAIVHYKPTDDSNAKLRDKGLYLIDSGGQYPGGTTDITRTIALGKVDHKERIDYTLVLKAHIGLATAVFPEATKGLALDALARQGLWKSGLNYGHGTGHGIGYFLNVHEGPQNISQKCNHNGFYSGMVTSNEPGIYREGQHGIRIENMMLCVEKFETEFGKFLEFETISLCPIDINPLETGLLTTDEIEWINSYHSSVFNNLSPHLGAEQKEWLKKRTLPII